MKKKKSLFLSLCAGLMVVPLLTGCSEEELMSHVEPVVKNETITPESKWINSSIDGSIDENTPVNVKDDFYTAVNKDYLLEPLAKGQKEVSRFSDIQNQFEENMYTIMTMDRTDTSGLDPEVMSEEALLHIQDLVFTVAEYGKDADTRNAEGAEPLRPYIEKIAGISSLDELTGYLCNTDGTNLFSLQLTPFTVEKPIDAELQNTYVVKFKDAPSLMLGSKEEPKEEYQNIGNEGVYKYGCNRDLLQYVLGQLGYSEEEVDSLLRACYRFESKLVRCLPDSIVKKTDDPEYEPQHNNIYSRDGLRELAGDYPLLTILSAYGLDGSDGFTVEEPTQMKEVGKLYTDSNLEDMKAYFIVNTVKKADYILDDKTFDLAEAYEKQEGTKKEEEQEERHPNHPDYKEWEDLYDRFVVPVLDDASQQIYIGHFCTAEEKQRAEELIDQIASAVETMIREADWMEEETRNKALEKLSNMGMHVLYPDHMIDYSSLTFEDCDNLADIAAAVSQFNARQAAARVNQPVDRSDWNMAGDLATTQVNAMYSLEDNSIYMMVGILADHYFFSPDDPIEEQLAKFGSVIGHEITHGFDTQGYQYDKDGSYRSWWTKEDRLAYDLRASKLIKYYSGLSPVLRGVYMKGQFASGEAIADMGGVKCGMILASEIPDFDYDLYFRTYANIWREHMTYKKALDSLDDPHPLGILRTNVTLMQFEEFQKTYDIQPGDGMYMSEEDRILVW